MSISREVLACPPAKMATWLTKFGRVDLLYRVTMQIYPEVLLLLPGCYTDIQPARARTSGLRVGTEPAIPGERVWHN